MCEDAMGLRRVLEEAATCSGFAVSLAALEWILMGWRQRVREARSLVEEIEAECRRG
jgi:hypothetical protein